MPSIIDVPVSGLVALRLLLEAYKGNFTRFLREIQGLGSVLDERIRGNLRFLQLAVFFIPFFSNCEFLSLTAHNNARNIE